MLYAGGIINGGAYYYPGTIKAVNYDGTFVVDYLFTGLEDGSGEKKKRKAGLYPKDLPV